MLGSYMEDIGITAAQFQESCGRGQGKALAKFQHRLFEQVGPGQGSSQVPAKAFRTGGTRGKALAKFQQRLFEQVGQGVL